MNAQADLTATASTAQSMRFEPAHVLEFNDWNHWNFWNRLCLM